MTSPEPPASRLASYLGGLGIQVPPDLDAGTVGYAAALDVVARVAREVPRSREAELSDQRSNLKLIASENFASPAVLLAMGNWLSDKYAEGAPGHRFYAGCDNVDAIESRAVELAKDLFGSDHAYIQPHSGIDANLVAFWSILTDRVEVRPLLLLAGYSSYPRRINFRIFREIADEVGATFMVDMAHFAGLVAGGVF